MASSSKPRFWTTEVIQTSAMDCGPACLTAMLNGHGVPVDYGRLREACQTGLDGTSIDTLEEVAGQLGLETEQTILVASDVFRPEASALPAIVVTRQPSGALHFVVAWRRVGPWLQIMDPGRGRVWVRVEAFERLLQAHSQHIASDDWRAFVEEGPFMAVLAGRLAELGMGSVGAALLREAREASGWERLAALDATTRFMALLVDSRAVAAGAEVRAVFPALLESAVAEASEREPRSVPGPLWSVRPAADGELVWTGAVVLRALGRAAKISVDSLDPLVRASLENRGVNPLRFVWDLLKPGGLPTLLVTIVGVVLGVLGVAAQAFAVRTLVTIDQTLLLPRQRLIGLALYVALLAVLASADLLTGHSLRRMGRHFESRLWVAFLRKMPLLPERYFQSRLVSDMAERIQSAQQLRTFPVFGNRIARALLQLALAATAIAVVDLRSLPIAALAFIAAWGIPLLLQPSITERDMRLRGHGAALSRFVLDALLGLVPARTHGAERAIRREHEGLLAEWVRAGRASLVLSVVLQSLQSLANAAFLIWLILAFAKRNGFGSPAILVILYWGAQVPSVAREILALSREYPALRNLAARLVEPLGAPEEVAQVPDSILYQSIAVQSAGPIASSARGVSLDMEDVSVMAGGHVILNDVTLSIKPGSHVAIVGRSGAGKSTILSLLLGSQQVSKGIVLVDGQTLNNTVIDQLRPVTAWVDPGIQLWNRTLLENIRYGAIREPSAARVGSIVTQAELLSVVERLPEGLQTLLGESGRLLSGGEGQRVRLARALVRNTARLVLLDEPFRGLERPRRRELLWRARAIWSKATLLCVSHDVSDTEVFDRVLVVDGGRIVEDGTPAALRARPNSVYSQLLAQEELVKRVIFGGREWRRLLLEDGRVMEVFDEVDAA